LAAELALELEGLVADPALAVERARVPAPELRGNG